VERPDDSEAPETEEAGEPEKADPSTTEAFWRWLATLTDDDALTFGEAAAMARMPEDSLRYMVYKSKTGPKGFRLGKKRVFRKGEIRRWIAGIEAAQRGAA
jgi:predicted DNA-binding transcriptional regulator AlpA